MTAWEARVDEAIRRTETLGVSPIRTVPIDMIADAVGRELMWEPEPGTQLMQLRRPQPVRTDDEIDRALVAIMRRNAFRVPVTMR